MHDHWFDQLLMLRETPFSATLCTRTCNMSCKNDLSSLDFFQNEIPEGTFLKLVYAGRSDSTGFMTQDPIRGTKFRWGQTGKVEIRGRSSLTGVFRFFCMCGQKNKIQVFFFSIFLFYCKNWNGPCFSFLVSSPCSVWGLRSPLTNVLTKASGENLGRNTHGRFELGTPLLLARQDMTVMDDLNFLLAQPAMTV